MATEEEITTWITALKRRLIEVGEEVKELEIEARDEELSLHEQQRLYDGIVALKTVATEIGNS